jgi:hypothetical protein
LCPRPYVGVGLEMRDNLEKHKTQASLSAARESNGGLFGS